MENPQGTAMPETAIAAYEFRSLDYTAPYIVTASKSLCGRWRACFVWHLQNDRFLRDNLLFCFRSWASAELHISDLKRIQFFAVQIDDAGRASRFKVIGAHREVGYLFPVLFFPIALAKLIKPAARRLQREISGQALEVANNGL
ncbi:hypothetical protein [Asticcacaulis excentricus]|uniref:hypothetical protein n=1 Tax=Asticcacaulis excentricus TaxID=78587 RepID=UPI000F835E2F|nr:hypothetical protein [Asticcacaulis excentricus]